MSSNPRPTKRLRRNIVVLSDDEGSASTENASISRTSNSGSFTKETRNKGRASESHPPTPQKASRQTLLPQSPSQNSQKASPRNSKKTVKLEEGKSKSLHNFFAKASEEQRWQRRSGTPETRPRSLEIEDDIIDDDDSMDEVFAEVVRQSKQDQLVRNPTPSSSQSFPSAQPNRPKFIKPTAAQVLSVNASQQQSPSEDSDRPWAERYGPITFDELCVNKKKMHDVERALEDMLRGRVRQRVLLLRGPAGSGKSAAIKMLSRTCGFDIINWQNPDPNSDKQSGSIQFGDFVARGGEYSALSFETNGKVVHSGLGSRRILMIEEFPPSLGRNSNTLDVFQSVLIQAASSVKSHDPFTASSDGHATPPIVIIISETLVSSSTVYSDSFTAQRILGPELMNHPAVQMIEFNRVAPTFLSKALDLVIKKEARDSGRRRIPGPAVLQKLSEIGDVRNAINTLQFLCTRNDSSADWSGTVAGNSKRGSKNATPMTSMEIRSLQLITSREITLDLFHAAGKICYNKREDPRITGRDRGVPSVPQPPPHLKNFERLKESQVDIDELLNETGTDIQTFVSTVHQNYVLSCNHEDFVDYLDGCASMLSDAELLDPDSRAFGRPNVRGTTRQTVFQLGTSDSLRQDEISFQVASRGVLFNLPFPVSRVPPPGANKAAAYKMYYPASLRLWRPIEETNDLMTLVTRQLRHEDAGAVSSRLNGDGVSSWKVRAGTFGAATTDEDNMDDEYANRVDVSREALLLDMLPFVVRIRQGRGFDVANIRKITNITGFNSLVEGTNPNNEVGAMEAESRMKYRLGAVSQEMIRKQAHKEAQKDTIKALEERIKGPAQAIEKLYLEEDDIEDD